MKIYKSKIIIHGSYKNKVKINILGSVVYTKISKQPIKEKYLLTGKLRKQLPYAIKNRRCKNV